MPFIVELDDLHDFNEDLADAVIGNTRRYTSLVSDVIFDLLPQYKEREVPSQTFVLLSRETEEIGIRLIGTHI